jgi:uncharacterized protein (DUF58 family)
MRARLLMAILGFLFVQMLVTPSKVWYFLLISFALVLGLAYLWTWSLARNVRAGRRYSSALVQVGDRLAEDFAVANSSLLPAPWLEVRDQSTLPGYSVSLAMNLGPQSEERWRAGGICRQRGEFTLGPWQVSTGDPFGLFRAVGEAGVLALLLVYPPIGRAPEVLARAGRSSGSRSHMEHSLEQTVTSAGLRQYVSGDPPRYIHWPASLRARELMVKDFDLEPAGDLWIVLDMAIASQSGEMDESTEEYMVLAATALAARALRREQAVGLLAYGRERLFLAPARGEVQYWRIMRALAMVRAEGTWPIGHLLEVERWNLGRGSTTVLLAPAAAGDLLVGVEILRRSGLGASVLLLDNPSFGGQGDTRSVAQQLVDLGIAHSVIGKGYEFVPVSRKERLRRRPRGTGRWGLGSS